MLKCISAFGRMNIMVIFKRRLVIAQIIRLLWFYFTWLFLHVWCGTWCDDSICMCVSAGEHPLTLLASTALERSPAVSHVNRCVRCWQFFLPSCLGWNKQINQAKPDQAFSTLLLSAHQPQSWPFVRAPTDPTSLFFRGPARKAQGRAKNGNKLGKFLTQPLNKKTG